MELCDANSLNVLFNELNNRGRRTVASKPASRRAAAMKRRCSCGICPQCSEAARWERIFQEKFADPDYYSAPLRHCSPLSDL